MIKSFANKDTELFYIKGKSKIFPPSIIAASLRKLDYLHAATAINDLQVPPGNRLELLKGALKGYYSIRINDQYRLVFQFENGHAYNVNIIDYHK